jgi:hypothetical protein
MNVLHDVPLFYSKIIKMLKLNPDNPELKIYVAIKSQMKSTKLQINLKLQNSMTKTLTAVKWYGRENFCPPKLMPLGTNAGGSFVWNFEFG